MINMKTLLKLNLLKKLKVTSNASYLLILIISLTLFFVVIFFLKVDVMVHGRGYLQIKDRNILIEHPDGGKINKLLAREGELVKEGQLLAIIDNSYIAEEAAKAIQQKRIYQIRMQRIKAEIDNLPFIIPENIGDDEKKYYHQERETYLSNINTYHNELTLSESVEKQRNTELEANLIKIEGLQKDIKYAEEQLKLVSNLVKIQAAAKSTLLTRQAELQKIKNELDSSKSMTKVLRTGLETAQLDTEKIKGEYKQNRNRELLQVQELLSENEAKLVGVNARKGQSKVYSPVSGRIQKLFKSHQGSVLPAGGALFEITPDNVPVIAVIKLDTKDRDKVWSGMPAKLDIGGTGTSKTAPVAGHVELVSADSFSDDRGYRYYQTDIIFESKASEAVYPGMVVDAYILTGQRSIASYLFSPVITGASRAFTEQ